jgi:hypothetical protein
MNDSLLKTKAMYYSTLRDINIEIGSNRYYRIQLHRILEDLSPMIFLTDISRDCQFHYGVIGLEYLYLVDSPGGL